MKQEGDASTFSFQLMISSQQTPLLSARRVVHHYFGFLPLFYFNHTSAQMYTHAEEPFAYMLGFVRMGLIIYLNGA